MYALAKNIGLIGWMLKIGSSVYGFMVFGMALCVLRVWTWKDADMRYVGIGLCMLICL